MIAVLAAAAVAAVGVQARIDYLVVTIRDQRTHIETTRTRTQRSVAVPSDVLFALDSARLTAHGRATLRGLELGDGPIRVTGDTDARGSAAYNRALSAATRRRSWRCCRPAGCASSRGRVSSARVELLIPPAARNRRVEISLG